MTQTVESARTEAGTRVDAWLTEFTEALSAGDAERAAALFAAESYWRDLVSFTWNLITVEGPAGVVRAGVARTPPGSVAPVSFEVSGERASRPRSGRRHRGLAEVRDRGRPRHRAPAAGRRRQGLDVPHHPRRDQGPRGAGEPERRPAVRHRARRQPRPRHLGRAARGRGRRARLHPPARGRRPRRRPGRHRPRRAAAPARRRDDHRREQREARRLLAQALQEPRPARPGLVRPPALPQVPGQLAGLLAEGQDRRLARDVREGHGAQLLGLHDRAERDVRRVVRPVDPRRRPRRRGGDAQAAPARLRPRRLGQAEHPVRPGCRTSSRARSSTRRSTPARTPTRARRSWSSGRTTRRSTSAARCGRSAPTSRWCSAAPRTSSGPTR